MTKDQRAIRQLYRSVFNGESTKAEGQELLAHLLVDMGYFNEIETEEERILHNYAQKIVKRVGIIQADTIDQYVAKLLETRPTDNW